MHLSMRGLVSGGPGHHRDSGQPRTPLQSTIRRCPGPPGTIWRHWPGTWPGPTGHSDGTGLACTGPAFVFRHLENSREKNSDGSVKQENFLRDMMHQGVIISAPLSCGQPGTIGSLSWYVRAVVGTIWHCPGPTGKNWASLSSTVPVVSRPLPHQATHWQVH